jgi:hypothetical protein
MFQAIGAQFSKVLFISYLFIYLFMYLFVYLFIYIIYLFIYFVIIIMFLLSLLCYFRSKVPACANYSYNLVSCHSLK